MKKVFKYTFIILIFIYIVHIFITQQLTLNAYSAESKEYSSKIDEEKELQKELNSTI